MRSTKFVTTIATFVVTCGLLLTSVSAAEAATVSRSTAFKIAAKVSRTEVKASQNFTLSGTVSPAKPNITVQRHLLKNGKWVVIGKVKTDKKGRWLFKATAPASVGLLKYKFVTPYYKKSRATYASVRVIPIPDAKITINPINTQMPAGSLISLLGKYSDVGDSIDVAVNQLIDDVWTPISAQATVGTVGWAARITLPMTPGTYSYQVVATTSRGVATSEIVAVTVLPPIAGSLAALGPGTPSRIWGMDIARYQHMADTNKDGVKDINDDGIPIDFAKAYSKGMRFVFIKASDGYVDPVDGSKTADDYALKFASQDRPAAQTAGLYTGLYHFPAMPNSEDAKVLIKDARTEAIQAAARLAQLGGYTINDLPYVLDVEHGDYGRGISRKASGEAITLWVKTWLQEMKARTGRTPIVYSGPNFIANYFKPDPIWAQTPLWIAHYGCTDTKQTNGTTKCVTDTHAEAIEKLNAGRLPAKGYNTVYHVAGLLQWQFWQYSSRAYGKSFGINNGAALDVNVFGGTSEQFMAFMQQLWQPTNEDDYKPVQTPITLSAQYETAASDESVAILVSANRIDNGGAALSGEISVTNAGQSISGLTVVPAGIGSWIVLLPPAAAETVWTLQIDFTDPFSFYAIAEITTTVTVGSIA